MMEGLLPPQFNDYANKADGLKPIRTVGLVMLGAKRAVLAPTANINQDYHSGWTNTLLRGHASPSVHSPLLPKIK